MTKRSINEPDRRRNQAEWRREQLLDAALGVFARKGVDGASVKDIAGAAGVTPGLLYHYFEGKEALVATLLRERTFLPELRRLIAGPAQRPASVVLPEIVRGIHQVLTDNRELIVLFIGAGSTNEHVREALRAFTGESRGLLAGYLASRVTAGELREHDTETVAQMLLSMVAMAQLTQGAVDLAELVSVVLKGVSRTKEE